MYLFYCYALRPAYYRFLSDWIRSFPLPKGEHGTGRNVAPFVELEWGKKALNVMKRIKNLYDPRGLLNPGVILNDDPKAHCKNLKGMPLTSEVYSAP